MFSDSLATDRTLSAFPEDIDSAFIATFCCDRLSELAALIERAPGRILLKPITETGTRSLAELAQEYRLVPIALRRGFTAIRSTFSIPCVARDGSPLTRSINPPTSVAGADAMNTRCNSNNNALSRSPSSAMKTYALTPAPSQLTRGWV